MLAPVLAGGGAPAQEEFLWPQNVPAWIAWQGVQTQWRVGMGDATGLDYAGVRAELDEMNLAPGEARRAVWAGIKACEAAVLEVWAERRSQTPGH